ncbi:MAG: tetratricopeptide repeat protein [Nitrospirae bacterium]|nr:tetratricopeptide repeat protein [Nitrospirota bacterium]
MSLIHKALKKLEAEKRAAKKSAEEREGFYSIKGGSRKILLVLTVCVLAGLLLIVLIYPKGKYKSESTRTEKAVAPTTVKSESTRTEIETDPDFVGTKDPKAQSLEYHKKGLELFKAGEIKSAEDAFKEALRLNPGEAVFHNDLGIVLKSQGNLEGAMKHYKEALAINPEFPEALNNLGVIYNLKGENEKALKAFRGALKLRPSYPEAHLNLAILLDSMGKTKEAENHYHAFLAMTVGIDSYRDREDIKKKVQERLNALKK